MICKRYVFVITRILYFILTLSAFIVSVTTADNIAFSSNSVSEAMDQMDALADDSGVMEVYYDYLEDGQLAGGKVLLEAPVAAYEPLMDLPAYNAYTLIDNGPCRNRIDVVCVGDGYTASEMDTYYNHIMTVIDGFFGEEAFYAYANYFNVHVVEVISNESGVDEPDKGIYKDTALDMYFNCSGIARLLCVDYGKAWTAAGNAPEVDLVIAFANTTRYGGAGYSDLSTLAGGNRSSTEVALHEFGHSFANLADEYHYSDGTTYTGSEPSRANISIYTAGEQLSQQLKWYRWLDLAQVDTYEGAYYKQYGIFRPTYSSKMKSLGSDFGPVNNEQIVFHVYQETTLIDSVIPVVDGTVQSGADLFEVIVQVPQTHMLTVQWFIDGVVIDGANETVFCPYDDMAVNVVQNLTVRVTDQTTFVRDEGKRDALMTQEVSWQVWKASADFDGNNSVQLDDLVSMASVWLTQDPHHDIAPPGGDEVVDYHDMAVLAAQWQSY